MIVMLTNHGSSVKVDLLRRYGGGKTVHFGHVNIHQNDVI